MAFLLATIVVTRHHEMWRDEIQAWLIARDSSSPLDIVRNTRYEGHPWLWHLLLWMPSRLTWNPAAMQALHLAIAAGGAWVLLRHAPFPLLIRMGLIFGYFFAYEWAVIARNYAIGALLLLLFAAQYRRGWRRAVPMGAALGAAGLTNVFALIGVLVLIPTLTIEYAVAWAGNYREARRWWPRALVGLALALAGAAAGLRGVIPPKDSGFATGWYFRWSPERYQATMERVIRAYAPVPVETLSFWNSNRLLEAGRRGAEERPWWGIAPEARSRVAWLILGGTLVFFFRRPWAAIPYVTGTSGILIFFYLKYLGAMRHTGYLWLWFVVTLWMAHSRNPWPAPVAWGDRWLRRAEQVLMILLAPVLFVHIRASTVAWRMDLQHVFSQAPAAAAFLRERYPNPGERLWAGLPSPQVSAVIGHLQLREIFYLDSERSGSFVIWDQARRGDRREAEIAPILERRIYEAGRPAVLILGGRRRIAPALAQRKGWRWLASFESAVVDEEYQIYEIPLTSP